jgi:transposase
MQTITTIGFDIAKSVFQVHCVDAEGKGHPSTPTQAALRAGLLPKAAAVLGWHRSLRVGASLVA